MREPGFETLGVLGGFARPAAAGGVDDHRHLQLADQPTGDPLALGGLQGAIGWWMVSSGLAIRTDVSHVRLAIHLITALVPLWRPNSPHEAPPS